MCVLAWCADGTVLRRRTTNVKYDDAAAATAGGRSFTGPRAGVAALHGIDHEPDMGIEVHGTEEHEDDPADDQAPVGGADHAAAHLPAGVRAHRGEEKNRTHTGQAKDRGESNRLQPGVGREGPGNRFLGRGCEELIDHPGAHNRQQRQAHCQRENGDRAGDPRESVEGRAGCEDAIPALPQDETRRQQEHAEAEAGFPEDNIVEGEAAGGQRPGEGHVQAGERLDQAGHEESQSIIPGALSPVKKSPTFTTPFSI